MQKRRTVFENIALCDEKLLNDYYESGVIQSADINECIKSRKIFPCMFGSALKLTGVSEFLECLDKYTEMPHYGSDFSGKVYKISEDKGQRLTFLKVTGGNLKVKEILKSDKNKNSEKVNQIRMYSGDKFTTADEVNAGSVCAVTGITFTLPGDGLGAEKARGFLCLSLCLPTNYNCPTVLTHTRRSKR